MREALKDGEMGMETGPGRSRAILKVTANIFSKGTNHKYFRLSKSCHLHHTIQFCHCNVKSARDMETSE